MGILITLKRGRQICRHFGGRWLIFRGQYAIKQKLGWLEKRLPSASWDSHPLTGFLADCLPTDLDAYLDYRHRKAPPFFFSPDKRLHYQELLRRWDSAEEEPQHLINHLVAGHWRFFGHTWLEVGFPPDWQRNALTGEKVEADHHWSQVPDFGYGDIKVIWEPSRFGFVYALVRAYWRTGEERFAELFWQLIESWRTANPPQQGPNWKCGQEISFRVMAWCFGLYGFLDAAATTAERVASLAQMIAVSGRRIEANLRYALSQRNNHGISEGMGLWTIGLLFPEFRRAAVWRERGRHVLEALASELIYEDGSFVQHSVNYHRLMLHDYLWSLQLGDLIGHPLSAELRAKVSKAADFLYQIQDGASGKVPHYGQDDGALILPLDNCDYQDYRPVLQSVSYLVSGHRRYDDGPWDEDLLWLFGPDALSASLEKPNRNDLRAEIGGYYTLRSPEGFVFTRCATYRHRPGQADMLHADLWWRGQNIALDAGTFSYNAPDPWDNPLAHTACHNTVTVGGRDQMDREGKFLWLPWLSSQVRAIQHSPHGRVAYWEGSHDGYRRLPALVSHRRGIIGLGSETWLFVDRLSSEKALHCRLHWLLADLPYEWRPDLGRLTLQTEQGSYTILAGTGSPDRSYSLVRADPASARGWQAPYYSTRQPALSLALDCRARTALFWTLFSPLAVDLSINEDSVKLSGQDWQACVEVAAAEAPLLITGVKLSGDEREGLELS